MNPASSFSVADKTVIVVGLGISGCAAVELLRRHGAKVIATDVAAREKISTEAHRLDCELVLGGHEKVPFLKADLIVLSPGVPLFPAVVAAEAAGVEVIGETELASRFIDVPICAIGGTNGKSTTTTLFGHLLEAAGQKVFVGGNLGQPACEAPGQGVDTVVYEVSSFQMERVPTFHPKAALLLNVSEDHLDRYSDFAAYVQAKGNCFVNQTAEDFAIFPTNSPECRAQVSRGSGRKVTYGEGGDYIVEGKAVVEVATGRRYDLTHCDLHGRHNHLNAAAAIAMGRVMGLRSSDIEEGLRRFRALPHRMARVGYYRDVTFYDDSKATNVGAAVTALDGLTEDKGVLIAGGRDKLGSYDELVETLVRRGRGAVLIGEAAPRLAQAIAGRVSVEIARTMQGAVVRAFRMARPGDAVLLSPACSSLDMFKNYSDRGERFTEAVRALSSLLQENLP
jgi:UDP-N-acetylmuramoylalanine--D-glutamate ligase